MRRIRVSQIRAELADRPENVAAKACRKIRVSPDVLQGYEIRKKSLDARKKDDIHYRYTVDLLFRDGQHISLSGKNCAQVQIQEYRPVPHGKQTMQERPVIIGAGPAGLFCALLLAAEGYRPLLLERGKAVEERTEDVRAFWERGVLNPQSNVQFGEGGAGTFSDGKLSTGVSDRAGRNRFVLQIFVSCGAPEEILYLNKPHIGTDVLYRVVQNLRKKILEYGGEIRFSSCVTDFVLKQGAVCAVTVNSAEQIPAHTLVLACGHSARDTFERLNALAVPMEAKAFAVGFRAEHPQRMIDLAQYGRSGEFPAADYKLTCRAANKRSVYSFCMCPGGFVVNASSGEGMLAVNGMSNHARNAENANSAIIVSVTPEDFGGGSVLSGMEFQRKLERAAFQRAHGKIPQQLLGDFEADRTSRGYGAFESVHKGQAAPANLRGILPEAAESAFLEGMHAFGKKIRGFDREDTILSGVESRTSSPVRILRDETMQSSVRGLYPCGEGAGYAGGIMSAAMDGMKTAERIMEKYAPFGRS